MTLTTKHSHASRYSCTYTYDANGNRATKALGGTTETYNYDSADKLTSITVGGSTTKSFTYDTAGRTTAITYGGTATNIAYDYENRITSITRSGVTTNSFSYNGMDTRVSKTDSSGSFTFKRDGVGVTAPVIGDGSAVYTPGISERRSSTTTYMHSGIKNAEAQGTTRQTVGATRQYDAFGNVTSSSGTWNGPFGYAGGIGYQEDGDHGFKLLGHRYYDPSTGRFLTRDGAKDGRNWFVYCDGNPMSRYDVNGQGWRRTAGSILGGIAGFILTGGNPIGAAIGSGIGGALGDAADQAEEKGEINWGQAALAGAIDAASSYLLGLGAAKLMKLALPMPAPVQGMIRGVHYTSPGAAAQIIESGVVNAGTKPGLGSMGGVVYAWPEPVPLWLRTLFGAGPSKSVALAIEAPVGNVSQNGLGHLVIRGSAKYVDKL